MKVGDRVYLNDPRNTHHGEGATIVAIDRKARHPYQARLDGEDFAFWYRESQLVATPPPAPGPEAESPRDFDRTGLGIGGLARHDMAAEVSEMIARGKMDLRESPRHGPMPNGQLWEPCPKCGQEPVCLDCGFCERHCRC